VALVFVLRFYGFEMYWKIIWLTWCIMLFQYSYLEKLGVALFFLNISDYCKEDDFERICIKVSKYTLCFVTCFSINKLVFPLTPLFIYLLGFSSFFYLTTFSDLLAIPRVKVLEHYTRLGDSLCIS
jgi:hypothetical protein